MTIFISSTLIEAGKKLNECPVELLLKARYIGQPISVDFGFIHIGKDRYITPEALTRWLIDRENGELIGPFGFDLGEPNEKFILEYPDGHRELIPDVQQ